MHENQELGYTLGYPTKTSESFHLDEVIEIPIKRGLIFA